MSDLKVPILSGESFQILEAKKHPTHWQVKIRAGAIDKDLNVKGTAEELLQVVSSITQHPQKIATLKQRTLLMIKGEKIEGAGVSLKVDKVNPYLLRLFHKNLNDENS